MELGLRGRMAMITGGSKGIGLATAKVFAAEGCNLILVARTATDLDKVKIRLEESSSIEVTTHAVDVSELSAIDRLVAAHPDIDILINNAGAIPAGRLDEVDDKRWRDAWELKVFGYINMVRAFYGTMKKRGRGVIINIIGSAGERLESGYIAGSTGNAGLIAFTKAMGASSPADNIRVVGINPGPIDTERLQTIMKKRAKDRFGDSDRWLEMYASLPFGRAGKPEEIASMAAFLASDLSAYTSGTVVTIDAGASSKGNNA
jgi:NAD(P)-dependent dehydrogenase (short-subunit alcohol dehydrogenase family)